jgi:hypothetical protein
MNAKAYKITSFDAKDTNNIFLNITPSNLQGIDLKDRSITYGFNAKIIEYEIEVFRNNKIIKILKNNGGKLSEDNRKSLDNIKNGEIRIKQIKAMLDCGLIISVNDLGPIKED